MEPALQGAAREEVKIVLRKFLRKFRDDHLANGSGTAAQVIEHFLGKETLTDEDLDNLVNALMTDFLRDGDALEPLLFLKGVKKGG